MDNKWNVTVLGRGIINDILQSSFEEEGDTCISLWIWKCDYIILLYSSKLFLLIIIDIFAVLKYSPYHYISEILDNLCPFS